VSGWRAHVPNALTASRVLVAAGVFAILATWEGAGSARDTGAKAPIDRWLLAACVLFVVGTLTDAFDGFLARRWRVISVFGRVMDPFADKILVLGTLILMAGPAFSMTGQLASLPVEGHDGSVMLARNVSIAGFTPIMVVLMLARELLVTSIRAVAEGQGASFPADWAGKAKMIVQSIGIPTILLILALSPEARAGAALREVSLHGAIVSLTIQVIAIITTAVTVLSAWPYLVRGLRVLRPAPISHQ
jgi:CDP-diacylglycerol---glycerol-3-phosphate 3-phosphatidyltransferase